MYPEEMKSKVLLKKLLEQENLLKNIIDNIKILYLKSYSLMFFLRITFLSLSLLYIFFSCNPFDERDDSYASCASENLGIQESILKKHLYTLSSAEYLGRASGTVYSYKAARYIENYYKNSNLVPAFNQNFIDEFEFNTGINIEFEKNFIEWSDEVDKYKNKKSEVYVKKKILVTPLPLARPKNVQGDIVFGGYCIKAPKLWDDLTSIESKIKDHIVVCKRFGPKGKEDIQYRPHIPFIVKYNHLKNLGAKGIIFIGGVKGADAPKVQDFPVNFIEGPPAIYVEPNFFFTAVNKDFYTKILSASVGSAPSNYRGVKMGEVTLQTQFTLKKAKGRNVAALLWPWGKEQKIVAVGAHFDHIGKGDFASMGKAGLIHFGADDNASGTAAVLELARSLSCKYGAKIIDSNFVKYNNVLFMHFDAEERGLLGSQAFVNAKNFNRLKVHAMINLDMVGRLRKEKGLLIQGAESGFPPYRQLLQESFNSVDLLKGIKAHWLGGGTGPSDHTSFFQKNISVLFVTTDTHPQYHTQNDTVKEINFEGLSSITQFVYNFIERLIVLEKPMKFRK